LSCHNIIISTTWNIFRRGKSLVLLWWRRSRLRSNYRTGRLTTRFFESLWQVLATSTTRGSATRLGTTSRIALILGSFSLTEDETVKSLIASS
jgi:hypothetical protein